MFRRVPYILSLIYAVCTAGPHNCIKIILTDHNGNSMKHLMCVILILSCTGHYGHISYLTTFPEGITVTIVLLIILET